MKSAATWTGGGKTATFDITSACDDAQEFSLKGYRADTFGSAVQLLTASGATIGSAGTQTGEGGDTVSANTLWMKLNAVFEHATYSGTITYIIANG